MLNKKILLILLVFCVNDVFAHGAMHDRLDNLTHKLHQAPKDTALLIERGRLYLDEHHPQKAQQDFETVLSIMPQNYGVYFYVAQAHLALKKHKDALQALDVFVQHQDQDAPRARGLALRGDIYTAMSKFNDAVIAYSESLNYKKTDALPDDYIRLADAHLAADASHTEQAIAVLDKGIKDLGSLYILEQRAMTIEWQANHQQVSLQRMNRFIAQQKTLTPNILLQKAKMEKDMGNQQQAIETLNAAQTLIANAPDTRSNTAAMQDVKKEIAELLVLLTKK